MSLTHVMVDVMVVEARTVRSDEEVCCRYEHVATYCNTLHHAATHCNKLQHAARSEEHTSELQSR